MNRAISNIVILFFGSLIFNCAPKELGPPNILLIMADDLGYSDLGCYGGEISTPNLDLLASNGLQFTQFYNTGRCWPTRAALLTGYYAQQVGRDSAPEIKGGGGGKRPDWAQLLPNYIKQAGYRSYHSGKWHIDGMPIENGFDLSYYLKDQSRFFNPTGHYENDQELPPISKNSGFYGTIEIANRAIEQLKSHEETNADKPFFSYVAFTAPHFPLHALHEDLAEVGDRYVQGWDQLRAKRWERIQELGLVKGQLSEVEREVGPPYHFPESLEILGEGEVNRPIPWDSLNNNQKLFQIDKMTIHAAMVERMDMEIGRIIGQLKAMEEMDNTLIIFLSDNGASAEIMVRADGHDSEAIPGTAETYLCLGPGWSNMCNTPFRRHKTWVHEGGTNTPFIAHWPAGFNSIGEIRKAPGHVIDIVPTILDLAGASIPKEQKVSFPGQSLKSIFEKDESWERKLWWYHEGNKAVRVNNWKLVAAKDQPWELFDMDKDRTETNDLTTQLPDKAEKMTQEWNRIFEEIQYVANGDLSKKNGSTTNLMK
jgi:arylsulfatase A-like enzyme